MADHGRRMPALTTTYAHKDLFKVVNAGLPIKISAESALYRHPHQQ
ncbi:hypothetical protein LEMLEM_LOCUS26236 [Lemmus lemmus]